MSAWSRTYLNVPYWTEFEAQAPGVVVPPALAALQQQIVGNSDPTAVFARTDFLLNSANTLNLQFDFNRVNATDIGRRFHAQHRAGR